MNVLPKRRWLRFSVRTLLVVVTAFAVGLGLVGWNLQLVLYRRAVYKELEAEANRFGDAYLQARLRGQRNGPGWWRRALGDVHYPGVNYVENGQFKYEDVIKIFPEADIFVLHDKPPMSHATSSGSTPPQQ